MEQLDQLRTMRDEAAIRLDLARAALERSPDAKLVNSLSSLITDLETSLGLVATSAKSSKKVEPEPEPVEEVASAEEVSLDISSDDMEQAMSEELASNAFGGDLSLEESLEAELLSSEENGNVKN